jgi:hypothetical protein
MRRLSLSVVAFFSLGLATVHALTVDEIVKLKQAGVSDSTIEMLIKGDGDSRTAGTWKTKDGWIVHTTETRERKVYEYGADPYPLVVFPRVSVGRR